MTILNSEGYSLDTINVLIVGAGGVGHGSSILKALNRSTLNLNIIAADMSQRLIHTADASSKAIIPPAKNPEYFDAISELIKKHSIQALFTGSEHELDVIGNNKSRLEALGVTVFMNNTDTINLCKNKLHCFEYLAAHGIDVPMTVLIESTEDIEKIDVFPVVIKPYKNSGASQNVFVAKDRKELHFICGYLLDRGIDIIAQEYIKFDNNEYTVGVTSLLDKNRVIGSVTVKKNLEGISRLFQQGEVIISSGITQGEVCHNTIVQAQSEKIARIVNSTGPLNVQLRTCGERILPFEINPRFSGTTSARAMAGYNEPEFFLKKYILGLEDETILKIRQSGFFVKGLDERFIHA